MEKLAPFIVTLGGHFRPFLHRSTPTHQVDDENYYRDHQQQVNQASSHAEAKAEQPKNQTHRNDSPKHKFFLLRPAGRVLF
jgi:hypothetical protein